MLKLDWCEQQWRLQQPWGKIHPQHTRVHYSANQVAVTNEDILVLGCEREPKSFHVKGNEIISPNGVGLISSIQTFKSGDFSIEAKLPNSPNMWPAFWLYGANDWPPEIDVFEGYSGDKGNYFKFRPLKPWAFWNVQSNVHYKDNGYAEMIGGKTHWLGFKNPAKTWNKYGVKWRPDLIEILFNDKVVRRIKNKTIVGDQNDEMYVVLNNMLTEGYDKNTNYWDNFYVKNFEYTPWT